MSIEIWDWGLGYIYLWDILIAWWGGWNQPFTYSYDFRNKSSTDLSNEGWSYTWTLETGANWVTAPNKKDIQLYKTFDFSNANKITITATAQWSTNDNVWRHLQFWCGNLTNSLVLMLSAANYPTSKIYLNDWTQIYWTDLWNIGTSTYTSTLEVDLVNKTVKWTIPWLWTSTLTLSDAQVTMIRWLPYLYFYTTQHTFYIQDISLTIE